MRRVLVTNKKSEPVRQAAIPLLKLEKGTSMAKLKVLLLKATTKSKDTEI